jgi:hypothetical protein
MPRIRYRRVSYDNQASDGGLLPVPGDVDRPARVKGAWGRGCKRGTFVRHWPLELASSRMSEVSDEFGAAHRQAISRTS